MLHTPPAVGVSVQPGDKRVCADADQHCKRRLHMPSWHWQLPSDGPVGARHTGCMVAADGHREVLRQPSRMWNAQQHPERWKLQCAAVDGLSWTVLRATVRRGAPAHSAVAAASAVATATAKAATCAAAAPQTTTSAAEPQPAANAALSTQPASIKPHKHRELFIAVAGLLTGRLPHWDCCTGVLHHRPPMAGGLQHWDDLRTCGRRFCD
mmetsp:Transcript_149/g.371  ORF Transcript_149/g.371 Transcript_149/m.371 type:complete len:210 (+) Transcript_149:856-1485(+)